MNKIKWGILGSGNISSKFATALNSLEDAEIVGVAAREMKRAEEFCEQYHGKNAYDNYEELAKNPDIQVIYIGTLHPYHYEHAKLCIEHGKAVLCEKPFTLNEKTSKDLMDLAKKQKVFLMEAMWTKFMPTTKKVKEWITNGKIGNVKYIKGAFGFQREYDETGRLFQLEKGGGALLDLGIYPITYAIYMLGKLPKKIQSSVIIGRGKTDEVNTLLMKFEDGAFANLMSASTVALGKDVEIIGDKGKILVPNFWSATSAILMDIDDNEIERFEELYQTNGYEYEAMEVMECIRQGKLESDVVPHKDTLDIMKIMDSLRNEWGILYPGE